MTTPLCRDDPLELPVMVSVYLEAFRHATREKPARPAGVAVTVRKSGALERDEFSQKKKVFLAHWADFDENAPCRVHVGDAYLESARDKPFKSFTNMAVAAAITAGDHYLWL